MFSIPQLRHGISRELLRAAIGDTALEERFAHYKIPQTVNNTDQMGTA